MSIAGTTVLLVVLMLPGVFFLAGFAHRERMSREIVRTNAMGDIGTALLVAMSLHLLSLFLLDKLAGFNVRFFFLPLYQPTGVPTARWPSTFEDYIWSLGLYAITLSVVSFWLGLRLASLVTSGYFRFLVTHPWAYDLLHERGRGVVTAYVMTNAMSGGKALMYTGRLEDFYLAADGRIAYLYCEIAIDIT